VTKFKSVNCSEEEQNRADLRSKGKGQPKSTSAENDGSVGREGPFLIKVCGITNLEDARLSLENGANALGFNFFPGSPRYLEIDRAVEIIRQLPGDYLAVGILVAGKGGSFPDLPAEINAVQIHGIHSESELPDLNRRTLVAVSPESLERFPNSEIIIDTSWGRGTTADWTEIRKIKRRYILSGGLNPENLTTALEILNPSGIDVCSGVESRPGIKDEKALLAFLKIAVAYVG